MLFAFASGTLAHLLPAVLPITRYTTDGLLLVLNGLLLASIFFRQRDGKLLWWLAIAYGFTFAMEAIGVATGTIFGEYTYGPTMWAQWLGVPFVIALNWCALTLACNEAAIRIIGEPAKDQPNFLMKAVGTAITAGVLTALYDVVIEPVAIKLDYWTWAAVDIPLQNYFAWAAIAFVISLPLYLLRIRFRSPLLLIYFFAQLFFFVVLNILL